MFQILGKIWRCKIKKNHKNQKNKKTTKIKKIKKTIKIFYTIFLYVFSKKTTKKLKLCVKQKFIFFLHVVKN